MRAALLLALCACAGRAGAVVVGIDFGARFLKVAAIKPGSGIEMVFNEASKRSSSAAVAFNMEDERVLGDDAYNLAPRLPKRTFTYVKNMLGKGHASPAVKALLKLGYPYAFELNKTTSTLAVRQDADTTYLVEELAAFILSYAKKISEDHVGAVVRDCVITVPPFWKASERLALMRAAEIAGLNVLSLLHESTAVAFKYGFDKEALFAEKPLNVVFYDVGAASYKVSVVEFASTANKKNKTTGSLTVKGVAWDEDLGGVHFDACVADYLVDSFVKAHPKQGKTLRSSERGMAKIRKEAERIKETLSANTEIPVAIEALHEEVDFRMIMKRVEFEQRCDTLWSRFKAPLDLALKQAGLEPSQVDKVEIVGGATRIPRIKQIALDYFGRAQLDMSLNGDEACALGAALYAAKMSTSFRLREFGITDRYPHEVRVKLGGGAQFDAEAESDGEAASGAAKEKVLFQAGSKFPHKKLLTLSRESDFSIEATLNGEPMASLEVTGVSDGISGVKTPKREPVGKPKASVTFSLNTNGLLEIAKAEVMLDVMETYDEYVTVNVTKNVTEAVKEEGKGADEGADGDKPTDTEEKEEKEGEAANATEGAKEDDKEEEGAAASEGEAAEAKEGDAPKGEVPTKEGGKGEKEGKAKPKAAKPVEKKQATKKEKVTKTSKRVHHVTLKSAATFTTPVPPITDAVVADCIARNKEMLEVEERKRIDAEAKNRVEAYALDTRDRMGEDEEQIGAVSTEEQRKELLAMFEEVEEWLYEGGRSVRHTVYQAKEDEMRAKGEPIFARLAELEARPAAVESARATITSGIETVGTWAEAKPQITEEETAKTLELATNVTSWLDEVVALQEGKAGHEEPAFTSTQVGKKLAPLEKAVRVLGKKPKPKPKVEEANTTATNATGSEDAAPAEAKEAGESKPAGGEGAAEGAAEPKKDEL